MDIPELKEKAEKGSTVSQCILGILYLCGDEVPQDYEKAFHYLTKAAEKGASRAIINLAIMYDEGLGRPRDIDKALQLYKEAAEREEPIAFIRLARLCRNRKSPLEAGLWYEKVLEFKECFEKEELQEAKRFLRDNLKS